MSAGRAWTSLSIAELFIQLKDTPQFSRFWKKIQFFLVFSTEGTFKPILMRFLGPLWFEAGFRTVPSTGRPDPILHTKFYSPSYSQLEPLLISKILSIFISILNSFSRLLSRSEVHFLSSGTWNRCFCPPKQHKTPLSAHFGTYFDRLLKIINDIGMILI